MSGADPLLTELDLNLLRVLVAVDASRHVTLAADRLGITQSAVSNALSRLRRHCGDELFVRTPQGMAPTPLGESLAASARQALSSLSSTLTAGLAFEPRHSTRQFTIRMTDIGEIVFLPALLDAFAQQAPGANLRTVSLSSGDTTAALADGSVELAIGFLPELRAGWFQQRLFEQQYVVLMRASHPLAARRVSARQFAAAEHLVIESPGSGHGIADAAIERLGVQRRTRLRTPDFLGAAMLIARSELIATVPHKLAEAAARQLPLAWCRHPLSLPRFTILQYWHPRSHRDAGHRWLRELIAGQFVEPPAPEPRHTADPSAPIRRISAASRSRSSRRVR
ncbi:MAG: LysR family transcriptional regulator [Burkholderiaceae bacterium]